jgi:hypothetical protein
MYSRSPSSTSIFLSLKPPQEAVKPCADAATTCSVVAHKPPNSLPLIDGDGQVGDPASEPDFTSFLSLLTPDAPCLTTCLPMRRHRCLCPTTKLDAALQRELPIRRCCEGAAGLLTVQGTAGAKRGHLAPRQRGAALGGLHLHGASIHRVLWGAAVRAHRQFVAAGGI